MYNMSLHSFFQLESIYYLYYIRMRKTQYMNTFAFCLAEMLNTSTILVIRAYMLHVPSYILIFQRFYINIAIFHKVELDVITKRKSSLEELDYCKQVYRIIIFIIIYYIGLLLAIFTKVVRIK